MVQVSVIRHPNARLHFTAQQYLSTWCSPRCRGWAENVPKEVWAQKPYCTFKIGPSQHPVPNPSPPSQPSRSLGFCNLGGGGQNAVPALSPTKAVPSTLVIEEFSGSWRGKEQQLAAHRLPISDEAGPRKVQTKTRGAPTCVLAATHTLPRPCFRKENFFSGSVRTPSTPYKSHRYLGYEIFRPISVGPRPGSMSTKGIARIAPSMASIRQDVRIVRCRHRLHGRFIVEWRNSLAFGMPKHSISFQNDGPPPTVQDCNVMVTWLPVQVLSYFCTVLYTTANVMGWDGMDLN